MYNNYQMTSLLRIVLKVYEWALEHNLRKVMEQHFKKHKVDLGTKKHARPHFQSETSNRKC